MTTRAPSREVHSTHLLCPRLGARVSTSRQGIPATPRPLASRPADASASTPSVAHDVAAPGGLWFVTDHGDRLHRVAMVDLDGVPRSRCGVVGGFILPSADGLRARLVVCGRCCRRVA